MPVLSLSQAAWDTDAIKDIESALITSTMMGVLIIARFLSWCLRIVPLGRISLNYSPTTFECSGSVKWQKRRTPTKSLGLAVIRDTVLWGSILEAVLKPFSWHMTALKIGSKCSFTPLQTVLFHRFLPCPALT